MKIFSKTTLAATATVALLAACGGVQTIEGTYAYDTAEQSRADAIAFVQAGSFCRRGTVSNISSESILVGRDQAAITYTCTSN